MRFMKRVSLTTASRSRRGSLWHQMEETTVFDSAYRVHVRYSKRMEQPPRSIHRTSRMSQKNADYVRNFEMTVGKASVIISYDLTSMAHILRPWGTRMRLLWNSGTQNQFWRPTKDFCQYLCKYFDAVLIMRSSGGDTLCNLCRVKYGRYRGEALGSWHRCQHPCLLYIHFNSSRT